MKRYAHHCLFEDSKTTHLEGEQQFAENSERSHRKKVLPNISIKFTRLYFVLNNHHKLF